VTRIGVRKPEIGVRMYVP